MVPGVGIGKGVGGVKNINKIVQMIKKGHSPKSIIRLDKGRIYNELPYIHFDNGAALNINGTGKHGYEEGDNYSPRSDKYSQSSETFRDFGKLNRF